MESDVNETNKSQQHSLPKLLPFRSAPGTTTNDGVRLPISNDLSGALDGNTASSISELGPSRDPANSWVTENRAEGNIPKAKHIKSGDHSVATRDVAAVMRSQPHYTPDAQHQEQQQKQKQKHCLHCLRLHPPLKNGNKCNYCLFCSQDHKQGTVCVHKQQHDMIFECRLQNLPRRIRNAILASLGSKAAEQQSTASQTGPVSVADQQNLTDMPSGLTTSPQPDLRQRAYGMLERERVFVQDMQQYATVNTRKRTVLESGLEEAGSFKRQRVKDTMPYTPDALSYAEATRQARTVESVPPSSMYTSSVSPPVYNKPADWSTAGSPTWARVPDFPATEQPSISADPYGYFARQVQMGQQFWRGASLYFAGDKRGAAELGFDPLNPWRQQPVAAATSSAMASRQARSAQPVHPAPVHTPAIPPAPRGQQWTGCTPATNAGSRQSQSNTGSTLPPRGGAPQGRRDDGTDRRDRRRAQ